VSETETEPPVPPPAPEPEAETDWQAEAEKWKEMSRRTEEQARKNKDAVTELEELRKSSMTEQEKAVAEAVAEARKEMQAETATRLAAAEVKAALTGVVDNPDSIVEDLNLSRYVTDDGDVDTKAIKALAERYAKLSPATGGTADLKQGARTPSTPPADGNAWLRDKVTSRQ